MPPEHDYLHVYKKHPDSEIEAQCRIRLYRLDSGAAVVIATELPDNPGISITNWAEQLATEIRRLYLEEGQAMIWIEQYPKRGEDRLDQETFDRVLMRWNGREYVAPEWKPYDRRRLETLLGEKLTE